MFLDNYINSIEQLCKAHNVKVLSAFGSVVTDRFNDNSDIDLLVDIDSTDPIDYAENYFDLKFKFEELLKKQIDLLEQKALKNTYLIQSINKNKKVLYEA